MSISITLNDVITSLITGVSSSIVFLFLLWNLKPKFKISDKICCEETEHNGRRVRLYLFKVINKSCFFKVYDVKVVAHAVTPQKNFNGSNTILSAIPIQFNAISMIQTFNVKHYFQDILRGMGTLTGRTDYAIKFFTITDCKTILRTNEKHIQFQITAKHSLTGFSKVETMKYSHVLKIENGSFLSGNSFAIVKQPQIPVITTN